MPTLFEQWQDLKHNTQIRVAMWLKDGAPERYPYIDDVLTIAESSAAFRAAALALSPAERKTEYRSINCALQAMGIKDFKPPQVPSRTWAKKLKGARRIEWTPAGVSKEC